MHRIIVGDGSIKSALNALHMRSTQFGRYLNNYTVENAFKVERRKTQVQMNL